MDITSVTSYRFAHTREDLALNPGERILAGGTWLMSEPQPDVTGFVDITRMDWPALAAVTDAAHALLMSFKVWNTATVGGNVCQSFTAAAMVSLLAALDAEAIVWTPDGGERHQPVASFVTGQMTNTLAFGEVLRAIEIPASALTATVSFHKMALAELGRSGVVVVGRRDIDDAVTVAVTASTLTPHVFVYDAFPDPALLAADVRSPADFFTDALGDADWRREITAVLAERVRRDLEERR